MKTALFAFLFSSCVSAPSAPPAAQAAARAVETSPTKGHLYLVRSSKFRLAVLLQITIDGRVMGTLPAESFLTEFLEPGKHTISVFEQTSQQNYELTVEPGNIYFLRIGLKQSLANRPFIEPLEASEGRRLINVLPMIQGTSPVS